MSRAPSALGILFALAILGAGSVLGFRSVSATPGALKNPHRELKDDCAACHSPEVWTPAHITGAFDHGRTKFPLSGAHVDVACRTCHGSLVFTDAEPACASCHEDAHRGELGGDCASCHHTASFVDRPAMERMHLMTRFPLTGAHQVADCESCHPSGAAGAAQYLSTSVECSACHVEDYETAREPDHRRSGFPDDCSACHSTSAWQSAHFDHDASDFPLTGAHSALLCRGCHGNGVYDGQVTDCASCHQDTYTATVEPNHTQAGFVTDCASCHTTTTWDGGAFDHATTSFALEGAHVDAACLDCHADGVYDGKSTECLSCHEPDYQGSIDPNHALFGFPKDCASCHSMLVWEPSSFDHAASDFPLTGAHLPLLCLDCHGDANYDGKPTDCASCHLDTYEATTGPSHTQAGFPVDCIGCHTTTAWTGAVFDHATTDFPLEGAHVNAACLDCHGDGVYDAKSTDCLDCHEADYQGSLDPNHARSGFPTDCASCHSMAAWRPSSFDHDASDFPLTGAHLPLLCLDCHGDGNFNGKATDCASCHLDTYQATTEPNHIQAGFPTDCVACHTTTTWDGAVFDHATTDFPLEGAHVEAACLDCHADGVYDGQSTDCRFCHEPDYQNTTDPNHALSGFPTDCVSCHSMVAWEPSSFDHDDSEFPLTGAHLSLLCLDCHGDGTYDGHATDCTSCHLDTYNGTTDPNHIQAGFPTDCVACHTTTKWDGAVFDHATTDFPLEGAHVGATCLDCHADGVYDGKPTECLFCHEADYNGTTDPNHAFSGFPTDCASCHSMVAWEPSSFDHDDSDFPLTGAHLPLLCLDCHGDGTYDGHATDCASCHLDTYNGTTEPNHIQAGFPTDCVACHTTTTWDGAVFDHTTTDFPLSGAHQDALCLDCHADGVYDGKPTACLYCHESDYNGTTDPNHALSGFPTDCADCHSMVAWEPSSFDHNDSDFQLTGAHVQLLCLDCHGDGTYDGHATDCASCHLDTYNGTTEPNHVQAGFPTDCVACHTTTAWTPATFDHGDTDFPLSGAHQDVLCLECHADGVYDGKPTACLYCHEADYNGTTDPNHALSGFPTDCADCHSMVAWEPSTFDHNDSDFPLTGAHLPLLCLDCHGDGTYDGHATDCASCHLDTYNGTTEPNHIQAGFPTDCVACHTTTTWDGAVFDHTTTDFPLSGAHQDALCLDCHADGVYDGKPTACLYCHESDYNGTTDPNHALSGFPTGCADCHSMVAWEPSTFDHDDSDFPLTGAHLQLLCLDCHGDGTYNGKATDCASCHVDTYNGTTDPNHAQAGFPTDCVACHTTSAWTPATFDHNDTDFPLVGAHQQAQCADCHGNGIYNGQSTVCLFCHEADYDGTTDPNHALSGFPTDCASCHSMVAWEPSTFDHNDSDFPLTGAHLQLLCLDCHGDGTYNGKATDCASCHLDTYNGTTDPNHAQAGFPTDCIVCHTTTAWTPATFDHNDTDFPLVGAHQQAQCADCHGNGIYNGQSTVCLFCHEADYDSTTDPNHALSGFPTDCASCHSMVAWEPSTFDHNDSDFPLTGAHIQLLCLDCHGDGIYNGKATDCASCHLDTYNGTTDPNHAQAGFPTDCMTCHTTTGWTPATFDHNQSDFPLTGAHQQALCSDCHGNGIYDGHATACLACHEADYNGTTDPDHSLAGFPTDCADCHGTTAWTPSTFNHDGQYFPIYTGKHREKWDTCSDCHISPTDYTNFSCIVCHEHSYRPEVDNDHHDVNDYTYGPETCYECHPDGRH